MTKKIWIVYKTESMSAPGWEERQLMPRGSLTNILWENWTWEENPEIPQVGDKTRDYENLSDPGNGVTHELWCVTVLTNLLHLIGKRYNGVSLSIRC